MTTDQIIRNLTNRLNERLNLTDPDNQWRFGYIGNIYGIPDTPAFRDDRLWTVWAPHPGRVGKEHENLGYVRTGNLDELRTRITGVLLFLRAQKLVEA